MMSGISQTDEQIPPVEHQRDGTGHQRLRSRVVKPPQPHWFFNSSKLFSICHWQCR